jgi:hypothetical protein
MTRWFRRQDDDLDREIEAHLAAEAEDQLEAGGDPAAARRAARRAFGNPALVKEDLRSVWRSRPVEAFWQDARFGLRMLRRAPLFTLFAITSLTLGLGAAGAVFALFDKIVWRDLPVRDPGRLVVGSHARPGGGFNYSMPYPQYAAMRERNTTLEGLFAVTPFGRISVTAGADSDVVEGLYAGGDYYATLGLGPSIGRLLTAEDDRTANLVAVISRSRRADQRHTVHDRRRRSGRLRRRRSRATDGHHDPDAHARSLGRGSAALESGVRDLGVRDGAASPWRDDRAGPAGVPPRLPAGR